MGKLMRRPFELNDLHRFVLNRFKEDCEDSGIHPSRLEETATTRINALTNEELLFEIDYALSELLREDAS